MTAIASPADGLVAAIYDCASYRDVIERLLPRFADYFTATSASFNRIEGGVNEVTVSDYGCYGLDAEAHVHYVRRVLGIDPMIRRDVFLDRADAFPLTSRFADAPFYNARFHHEFTRANGIGGVMVLRFGLPPRQGGSIVFNFHRPPDATPFGERETALASRLMAPLGSTLGRLGLDRMIGILETVIDDLATGSSLLVLDRRYRPLYANRAALPIKAAIEAGRHDEAALDAACRAARHHGTPALLPPGALAATSLTVRHRAGPTSDKDRFVLSGEPQRALPVIGQTAALTKREGEIAAAVVEGNSNKEIARRLGISVFTVENHLRAIYPKLGVSSRSRLIARLGRSSAE